MVKNNNNNKKFKSFRLSTYLRIYVNRKTFKELK